MADLTRRLARRVADVASFIGTCLVAILYGAAYGCVGFYIGTRHRSERHRPGVARRVAAGVGRGRLDRPHGVDAPLDRHRRQLVPAWSGQKEDIEMKEQHIDITGDDTPDNHPGFPGGTTMYRIAIAIVIAGALGLASCAKDTTTPPAAAPTLPSKATSTPTTTTTTGPAVNERGLISKTLGEDAGLGSAGDSASVTFTIDAVAVDPPCDEFGIKPDSGRTLLLDVRVATGSDQEVATYMSGLLNPYSFGEIGKDGVTRTAQAGSCTDYTKALPSQFGVNQKYSGTIEIVVPEASGVLVLQDTLDNSGGWEWSY